MSDPILPVILSGGSGTRLWPLSRPERPKQLLPVTEERTMLQLTLSRTCSKLFQSPIIVANEAHADEIERQMAEIEVEPAALILEPVARNTAPAIALAALAAPEPKTPLLVMPSDHSIGDVPAFHEAVARALPLAKDGWLVTFGIEPTGPETGYGYIKKGEPLLEGVQRAERFVEKPSLDRAQAMIDGGDHAWNGGIFLFCADAFLNALRRYAPEILSAAERAMKEREHSSRRICPAEHHFAAAPSISVDNAVMELSDRVAVVPVSMNWSDVGSWDALYALSSTDESGNVVNGDVTTVDVSNCLVRTNGIRIAAVGISDLIVIADGSDVLIMPRGHSQDIKKLTPALAKRPFQSGPDKV